MIKLLHKHQPKHFETDSVSENTIRQKLFAWIPQCYSGCLRLELIEEHLKEDHDNIVENSAYFSSYESFAGLESKHSLVVLCPELFSFAQKAVVNRLLNQIHDHKLHQRQRQIKELVANIRKLYHIKTNFPLLGSNLSPRDLRVAYYENHVRI
ncbi:hypothetical protein HW555_007178 [Spodoptera exigua]|uniref:Uncharacterized protein n=1 Tax=Spodoptera exigua TaxID=7107 RepID=A0A835GHB3_SPOEX|nr:hypothetical protein HW555_007178 [Spodoptera exigua]